MAVQNGQVALRKFEEVGHVTARGEEGTVTVLDERPADVEMAKMCQLGGKSTRRNASLFLSASSSSQPVDMDKERRGKKEPAAAVAGWQKIPATLMLTLTSDSFLLGAWKEVEGARRSTFPAASNKASR